MNIQEVKENARWAFVSKNIRWESEPRRNGLVILTGWYLGEDISLPYVEDEGDPHEVKHRITDMFLRHGGRVEGMKTAVLDAVRLVVIEGAIFGERESLAGGYLEVFIEFEGETGLKKVLPSDVGRGSYSVFVAEVRRELVDGIARSL